MADINQKKPHIPNQGPQRATAPDPGPVPAPGAAPATPQPRTPIDPGELLSTHGTLTLKGETFAVEVVLSLIDSAGPLATVNLWNLVADLAALNLAILKHDATAAGASLTLILSDLGIALSAKHRQRIIDRLAASAAAGGASAVAPSLAKVLDTGSPVV